MNFCWSDYWKIQWYCFNLSFSVWLKLRLTSFNMWIDTFILLWMHLYTLCLFFYWVVFFLLIYKHSLHILVINTWSVLCVACNCINLWFIFYFYSIFCHTKWQKKLHLSGIFFIMVCGFVSYLWNYSLSHGHKNTPLFSLKLKNFAFL